MLFNIINDYVLCFIFIKMTKFYINNNNNNIFNFQSHIKLSLFIKNILNYVKLRYNTYI
jgi:hypothetical protein